MNKLEQAIANAIEEKKTLYCPSLKSFAIASGMNNPVRLYTVAKQPIAGVVYDARVFNWDAIASYFEKRFDPDVGFANFDDLVNAAIKVEQQSMMTDRRTKKRPESLEKLFLNGKAVPSRKTPVQIDMIVAFKEDDNVYKVVYCTDTHVVLQVNDTSEIVCFGNWTFNNKLKV